ncbi:MAG: hypothetical protein QOF36_1887, partial [Microbacteriaceae bacterium]|nr:hypothetical protein [Microbacteriaceae bacterium]
MTILIVGAIAAWLRLPASAQDTLWAEDARIFLNQAVHTGPFPALFSSYAGYLHTVPRIIAGLVVQFVPIELWANSMAGGACFVAAGVAALVFVCSRDVVGWLPARLVLASITILVPLAPREVLGNTANLHWYFLWLTPWLLLYRPRSRSGAWMLGVAALLAALTEIQMAMFVPLLLWGFRDRVRWPVRALFLVGVSAQVLTTLLWPRGHSTAELIGPVSLAYGYLINCVMTIWLPSALDIGKLLTGVGPIACVVFLLPFLAAAAWGLRYGNRLKRVLVVTLLLASVVLYATAVEISPGTFYDYARETAQQIADPWLARYGVVPSMMLLALIPIAVTTRRPGAAIAGLRMPLQPTVAQTLRRVTRLAVPWAASLLVVTLMLAQFAPASTRRSGGPLYEPQVAAQTRA